MPVWGGWGVLSPPRAALRSARLRAPTSTQAEGKVVGKQKQVSRVTFCSPVAVFKKTISNCQIPNQKHL